MQMRAKTKNKFHLLVRTRRKLFSKDDLMITYQKQNLSKNDIPVSDAPTTTILALITTFRMIHDLRVVIYTCILLSECISGFQKNNYLPLVLVLTSC